MKWVTLSEAFCDNRFDASNYEVHRDGHPVRLTLCPATLTAVADIGGGSTRVKELVQDSRFAGPTSERTAWGVSMGIRPCTGHTWQGFRHAPRSFL